MIAGSSPRRRVTALIAISAVTVVAVALHGPIPQDPTYHSFADQREILGVPNFWNVASNLPFAIVGIAALLLLRTRPPGVIAQLSGAYVAFFGGAVLVAFGSAYYHLHPNATSLVWDRLPMTVSFMAFFAIVAGEHGSATLARQALPALLALGVASVAYWAVSEHLGHSDLRPYLIVQFLPILLIPLILVLFPSRLTKVWLVWVLLAFYGVAKLFESFDAAIYARLGFVSGHTLKHLSAATGMLSFVMGLRLRHVVASSPIEQGAPNPSLQRTRFASR